MTWSKDSRECENVRLRLGYGACISECRVCQNVQSGGHMDPPLQVGLNPCLPAPLAWCSTLYLITTATF